MVRFPSWAVSRLMVRCRSSAANSPFAPPFGMPRRTRLPVRASKLSVINEKLENIKTNIGKQYQRLCDRDSYVTAEKVRNAFLGMGDDCRLLLQTFDEYLAGFLKRVGKDRAYSSYDNYRKRRLFPRIRIPCKRYSFQRAEAGFHRKVCSLPLLGTRDAFRDDPFDYQETEADDLHGV